MNRTFIRHMMLAAAAGLVVLAAGCGAKTSRETASSSATLNDYKKPNLTEAKLARFESLEARHNPLEFVFKQGGALRGLAELSARASEYNAFAQKYGFKNYEEYLDCWGRTMVGQMQLASAKFMSGASEMWENQIKENEENLKRTGITEDERKTYADQLDTAKKALADSRKPPEGGLNAQDTALVEKFLPQIDEALKKYKPAGEGGE